MDCENKLYSLLANGFCVETYSIKLPHSSFIHKFVFDKDYIEWYFAADKKVVFSRCDSDGNVIDPDLFAEDVLGFMQFVVLNYLQLDEQDYEYFIEEIVNAVTR